MECPNEFTWAMFCDGELPQSETSTLRLHLAECAKCRELTAALQEESRALVHAFQHLDEYHAAGAVYDRALSSRGARARLAELAAAAFGLALAVRIAFDSLTGHDIPAALDWLNPFHAQGQVNFLLTSFVYLLNEGGPNIMSLVSSFGILAAAAAIVIGAPRLLRRSTSAGILLSFVVVLLTCSMPAFAIDHRSGGRNQESIVVAAGETVDDTLFATGESVIVEGTVNGDVIAAARSVEVRGAIHGNLIAFAQNVLVEGNVDGTTYAFGQNIRVRGRVMRDMFGFGQAIALEPNGKIGRNLVSFAQVLTADGEAGRDVIAFVQRFEARGSFARDLSVNAQQVSLLAPAHVERDFVAGVPQESNFKMESGASIGGKRNIHVVPPEPSEYATVWFYVRQVLWLIAAFITGLVLFWLFPALSRPHLDKRSELLESGVFGFLATVATPVAAVIIAITIIGLPIALVSLALWIFGLYVAKIVVAAFVGRSLFGTPTTSLAVQLLAGLLIVLIAVDIPYVGGLVNFLLTIVGLGAILIEVFKYRRRPTVSPALP